MSGKSLESVVKETLGLSELKNIGLGGGGCINTGSTYETDKFGRVFIKVNSKPEARKMFDGEFASLEALRIPCVVKVPKPIVVVDQPGGGAALIMEYVQFSSSLSTYSAQLGEQLATLHLHNSTLEGKSKIAESSIHKGEEGGPPSYVSQFGFHVPTCCGFIPQENTWTDSWEKFYANKIEQHIQLVEKKGDKLARSLWNTLVPKLGKFFEGVDIKPAIMHGDLWGGNASEVKDGPVIFDPASFYGHSEYDLGITHLFGGFNSKFYEAYHKVIPKAAGYKMRKDLYMLFHYLNHWNHFGGGYRGSSISLLQSCVDHVNK